METSHINRLQFRNILQAFTNQVSDSQCNEVFNMLTKRRESTADSKSALKKDTDDINRDINGR